MPSSSVPPSRWVADASAAAYEQRHLERESRGQRRSIRASLGFVVLSSVVCFLFWSGASPAHAGIPSLIFRDSFEWGLSRWSSTLPTSEPQPVVWQQQTTEPTIDLQNCDLPPGNYILRVRAENEFGVARKEVSVVILEIPCDDVEDQCRQIIVTDLP